MGRRIVVRRRAVDSRPESAGPAFPVLSYVTVRDSYPSAPFRILFSFTDKIPDEYFRGGVRLEYRYRLMPLLVEDTAGALGDSSFLSSMAEHLLVPLTLDQIESHIEQREGTLSKLRDARTYLLDTWSSSLKQD